MNYNKVILAGRLTKDLELKYTTDGKAVTNLNLAVNRKWTDKQGEKKEETLFMKVAVWGKQAENCAQYLHKGSGVLIDGSLKAETWEKDGVKHNSYSVRADNVQFADSKPQTEQTNTDTQPAQEEKETDNPF